MLSSNAVMHAINRKELQITGQITCKYEYSIKNERNLILKCKQPT